MAPKLFSKTIYLTLILSLYLAMIPAAVFAAPSQTQITVKENTFKFYLAPELAPDMKFAKTVLAKYVNDMNVILAKNTSRRLVFNPETDIILVEKQPHSNQATPPLPLEGFEIWAYAIHTNRQLSYGGYGGIDTSGAGVLAGLKWTKIYDPDHLKPSEVPDYWTQINNMLHELAHVFGAGYGEYYNLSTVQDLTGAAPLLNINILDQKDTFWSNKPDFMADPLLKNPVQNDEDEQFSDRESLLNFVEFSALTAKIISDDYRNGTPAVDLSQIKIKAVSADGSPLDSASVKVWSVMGVSPFQSQLMTDGVTNESGELSFAWGGNSNPHNSYDFLRLIKVYKEGYTASAKYVSVFDADIAKLVDGSDILNIKIQLTRSNPSVTSTSTFADVSADDFAKSAIEKLYTAGITTGCSPTLALYCPDEIVTRAQMAVFLERSKKGSSFSPPTNQISFSDTTDHWARYWIEVLAVDGVTSGCGNGNFCPDAPVTRAQMAIFLLKAKHGSTYSPPAATGVFKDVPAGSFAESWIEQLAAEGVTSGCGGGNYCPDESVTRAQMAVFLVNTFSLP